MNSVSAILFGAAWTSITGICLGLLLLQTLRVRLRRGEAVLLSFISGSAILSTLVFLCLAAQIARPWVFVSTGAVAITLSVIRKPWRDVRSVETLPSVPWLWRILFALAMLTYGIFTLAHAMAPEISPDGSAYHLGTVARYFRDGGFTRYTTNMYANLPMGVEMLFLYAFAFGRHSAAALVHWQFLVALPFLIRSCGQRLGFPAAGTLAGLLVFLSPVVGLDGASAYVDVGAAAMIFGLFYVLQIWDAERQPGLLILAGILAGASYACKLTAFPAIFYAVLFAGWRSWRTARSFVRPAAIVAVFAALLSLPWLSKNVLIVGNPLSPFFNRWFPNPYVKVSFEEEYRSFYRDYYGNIKSPAQLPLEVTVRGGILQGLLGPVFLLAPLALLSLKFQAGRHALLASAFIGSAYPGNIGTRFLITVLPFVALALAVVLTQWRVVAVAVLAFHAGASWPNVVDAYCDPYAWRFNRFRGKQALRLEREDDYLRRAIPAYNMARAIDDEVPPDARILSFGGVPEAYTSRDLLVAYQGGFNNVAGDLLTAGISPPSQPLRAWEIRFPSIRIRRLRMLQTARVRDIWSVSEVRIFSASGEEYPRTQAWRVRAHPNPWEVQFAFDNGPLTRWRTWQAAQPGDSIELDFGQPLAIEHVRIEFSPDQPGVAIRLQYESSPGEWTDAGAAAQQIDLSPPPNTRLTATSSLKKLGIQWLAIGDNDFIASDLVRNKPSWGVTEIAHEGGMRLYKLD